MIMTIIYLKNYYTQNFICLNVIISILFKIYFIDYAITFVLVFYPCFPLPSTPIPSSNAPRSSCPWVVHVSSLASPFPVLFLTSPCLFCTYQLYSLIPLFFPLFSPFPFPTNNPPNDLNIYDSIPVLAC